MLPRNRWFASLVTGLLLTAPWFTAHADQPAAPAPVAHHHRAHRKPTPLVLPPLPPGPLRQVPLDQLPASAPRVTYQNGLLSIAAQNSTLAEILRDVRQLTGASVELPPNGGSERVVTQLGPGAPRDVLALLLNGTAFNYVMLGSTSDPNAVATIVLTTKSSSAEGQTVANAAQPAPEPVANTGPIRRPDGLFGPPTPGAAPVPQPVTTAEAEDNSDDSDDDKDDDSDQAQPAVQPGQAVITQPGNPDDQSGNQPNAGPRTPEQILEMLRRGQPPQPGLPPGPLPQQPPQQ